MAESISAAQIRGARAMLDWSLVDLSRQAHVSVSVVRRFERGEPPATADDAHDRIRLTLESAGVRFVPDEGIGQGLHLTAR